MNPERPNIPDWARYERASDLEWLEENMDLFWSTATAAFEEAGHGVILVDATEQPIPGAGHPMGYFSQEQIESYEDDDITRMASDYDPDHELVVVLLKPEDRVSTYRICTRPPEPEPEPMQEPKLQPPSLETLISWEMQDGGAKPPADMCVGSSPRHVSPRQRHLADSPGVHLRRET